MFYYCPYCRNVYDGKALRITDPYEYNTICPLATCNNDAFEIDEEMIVPIQILNEKGYWTRFCCSGHVYTDNSGGYLMFDTNKCRMPDTSPKGWYIDEMCIRYDSTKEELTPAERRKYVQRKINALVTWCESLPEAEEPDPTQPRMIEIEAY